MCQCQTQKSQNQEDKMPLKIVIYKSKHQFGFEIILVKDSKRFYEIVIKVGWFNIEIRF